MPLEGGKQLVLADRTPAEADVDVPGLVVDPGADVVEFALVARAEHGRDLVAAVLDAMAEPDGVDLAVFERRPGVHRHRVGVVEEARPGGRHLADVLAEVQDDRDVALAVEDAARADRVADALVDAVFERDADVIGIGLEAADADAADDVVRALERLAAIGGRGDGGGQPVGLDHAVEHLPDHRKAVLADVGQCELGVAQLRDRHDVGEQASGEADAPGANDGDLELVHEVSKTRPYALPPPGASDGNAARSCVFGHSRPSPGRLWRMSTGRMGRVKFDPPCPNPLCPGYD